MCLNKFLIISKSLLEDSAYNRVVTHITNSVRRTD